MATILIILIVLIIWEILIHFGVLDILIALILVNKYDNSDIIVITVRLAWAGSFTIWQLGRTRKEGPGGH